MNPCDQAESEKPEGRDPHTGRFLPGNKACPEGNRRAEIHGVATFERRGNGILPDVIRESERAFYAQTIADLGGLSEIGAIKLGYVRNLTRVHTIIEILSAFISEHGATTPRGRQRGQVPALLTALATFDRLAQRLGLERQTKSVDVIEAYVAEKLAARNTNFPNGDSE